VIYWNKIPEKRTYPKPINEIEEQQIIRILNKRIEAEPIPREMEHLLQLYILHFEQLDKYMACYYGFYATERKRFAKEGGYILLEDDIVTPRLPGMPSVQLNDIFSLYFYEACNSSEEQLLRTFEHHYEKLVYWHHVWYGCYATPSTEHKDSPLFFKMDMDQPHIAPPLSISDKPGPAPPNNV
jgi:hypothetical protein